VSLERGFTKLTGAIKRRPSTVRGDCRPIHHAFLKSFHDEKVRERADQAVFLVVERNSSKLCVSTHFLRDERHSYGTHKDRFPSQPGRRGSQRPSCSGRYGLSMIGMRVGVDARVAWLPCSPPRGKRSDEIMWTTMRANLPAPGDYRDRQLSAQVFATSGT